MKRLMVLTSLGCLFVFCLALSGCGSKGFVGTWKPAPGSDKDVMRIDSFNINKDGTFSIKFKEEEKRKETTGTYKIENEKLLLTTPDGPPNRKPAEGIIEKDGRLKITEPDRSGMATYFARG